MSDALTTVQRGTSIGPDQPSTADSPTCYVHGHAISSPVWLGHTRVGEYFLAIDPNDKGGNGRIRIISLATGAPVDSSEAWSPSGHSSPHPATLDTMCLVVLFR